MAATIVPPSLQQRLVERARPPGSVVMLQRWEHLAFLHWRYDVALVQSMLPPGLWVDAWDNTAWVGLVPLFMRDIRPRFVPAIPAFSDFLELNLRTYVYDAMGRPGIYFFSLDCDQPLAVESARRLLHLHYEHATMNAKVGAGDWVDFEVQRTGSAEKNGFRYRSFGQGKEADHDSLDFFLLERYRLFAGDGPTLKAIRICHAPYRVRPAHVTKWSDTALRQAGFPPPDRDPDHLCATDPVDVETFAPETVA